MIVDLTSKLVDEEKFIKIGDVNYKVDDSKNTVMRVYQILDQEGDSINGIDEAMELMIGKKGMAEINKKKLSMQNYQTVFIAVMSLIKGEAFEKTFATFQQSEE